tara:strand:- start:550 stop:1173 length:624 start_codon:yes stop_codon:yes gene_type:complete
MPTFTHLQKLSKQNRLTPLKDVPVQQSSAEQNTTTITGCVPDPICPVLTLYYSTGYIPDGTLADNKGSFMSVFTQPYPGFTYSVRSLTDEKGNPLLNGNDNCILWEGVRLPVNIDNPDLTTLKDAMYLERFNIQFDGKMIAGESLYSDAGSGTITAGTEETFIVNGSNMGMDIKRVVIQYDNSGENFLDSWNPTGLKKMRRIQFFTE